MTAVEDGPEQIGGSPFGGDARLRPAAPSAPGTCVAGHRDLDDLYRAIAPRLLGFARRAEPDEADDIAADVWLGVVRYLPHFRGDAGGFEALVFTVARRRIIDVRRRRARRRTDPVANEVLGGRAGPDAPDVEAIDRLRTRASIDQLTATLSPAQVEVVVLRVVHDLSVERTAAVLGRTPGNVRVLHHRALQRLRA